MLATPCHHAAMVNLYVTDRLQHRGCTEVQLAPCHRMDDAARDSIFHIAPLLEGRWTTHLCAQICLAILCSQLGVQEKLAHPSSLSLFQHLKASHHQRAARHAALNTSWREWDTHAITVCLVIQPGQHHPACRMCHTHLTEISPNFI